MQTPDLLLVAAQNPLVGRLPEIPQSDELVAGCDQKLLVRAEGQAAHKGVEAGVLEVGQKSVVGKVPDAYAAVG